MPSLAKDGDIVIGGIFPVFNKQNHVNASFEKEPPMVTCDRFHYRSFRWTQVMIFAINEINSEDTLLPNISLGYKIFDSCSSPTNTLRAALSLLSETDGIKSRPTAQCQPPISALIADAGSSQSVALAGTFGPFNLPMVSYFSTCACLSDKSKYPTFFRTIPSDHHQAKALAFLVKRFRWEWIGTLQSDNDYGRNGLSAFIAEVKKLGVCIAFTATVDRTYHQSKMLKVVDMIKISNVQVILAFAPEGDFYPVMKEIVRQNITGIQWIASEAWIASARPSAPEMFTSFAGTIGFSVRKMAIPKLRNFLTTISPYSNPGSVFFGTFWETLVGCRPFHHLGTASSNPVCRGNEVPDLTSVFFNVTRLRVSYNVYMAVYAIAHAIHELIFCNQSSPPEKCLHASQISPKLVTAQLRKVKFLNEFGETVFFDSNGDFPPSYDIINWQMKHGEVKHVTVGHFSTSANAAYKLFIQEENIIWSTGNVVPKAVCSEVCPAGTRRAPIKGRPSCCFDCVPCADGTITNHSGALDCTPCPEEYWSNEERSSCVLKYIEVLSFQDTLGIILTAMSLFGASLTLATTVIFLVFRHTPLVRANNAELSALLLLSLFLCFLCPLAFIAEPTAWSCMLRHTAFGVTFALCISCVLGKTLVVITAFRATLPGATTFGPVQQRIIVYSSTGIQVLICILWLSITPPYPQKRHNSRKIIVECNTGSDTAFYAVLGYIGFLAGICLVVAFLARKLPDNFNEAKFITFSMLVFCAVWITFIPAYVSSPGKYTVAVEIFAILSSAFGLLVCIFAPKCFIIIVQPEKNTKKHMMGKVPKSDH
ncbi:extracellular calcium-sensing receptor-like [Sardina pilchardus]|uniref:extracellular calcium-sensing receptor-like n=1 Tax=Sardina pilchardus TaxID=27697 RepID=UPI002E1310D9